MNLRSIKKQIKKIIWLYRQVTWRSRPMPDFIVIGSQKSGTTSLFTYLGQHPHISLPFKKELHFFDGGLDPKIDNFEKGEAWYSSHFQFRKNKDSHNKTFDSTPLYIFNHLAPSRIFRSLPNVKLIVVLRNPTERAISHYFHSKRKGHEWLPIMEALHKEDERLSPVIKKYNFKSEAFIHHSYKSRGLYKYQIERYLEYFNRQQMLIISSDDLFDKTEYTLRNVFGFVGVEPGIRIRDLSPQNIGDNKREVDPDVYSYLNDFFFPHNQELYRLLGKSFDW